MADIDREPLLNTQQNQLGALISDSASIDAKALGLLAAIIAILIFIGQADLQLALWQWVLLLWPFVGSLFWTARTLYPRDYLPASIRLEENPEYLTMDQEDLVLQLISDTQYAIVVNSNLNYRRWRSFVIAFACGLVGSLVLLILLTV